METQTPIELTGLTEELKQEMLKHTGFSQDHIKEHYDDIAQKYDAIYLNAGYYDPLRCAELVRDFVAEENRGDAEVIDMGCGTGLAGHYLKEMGFKKIVGVDASKGMLDVAAQKNAYSELKELFLGSPTTFP